MRLQKEKLKHGVRKVKQGVLRDYQPYLGSDGDKSSEVEDPMRQLYNDGKSNKGSDAEFSDFDSDDMLQAHEI